MSLDGSVPGAAQVPEERHLLPYGFSSGAIRLLIEAKKNSPPLSLLVSFLNLIPMLILFFVFLVEYFFYVFVTAKQWYILPGLENSDQGFQLLSEWSWDSHKYVVRYFTFNVCSLMLLVSMLKTMFTRPGEVSSSLGLEVEGTGKDGKLTVLITERLLSSIEHLGHTERKKSMMPRYCRTCLVIKPDRSHHCSVCNRCVLRMDHHCPYINNCVGQHNYKFFMNMLIYGAVNTWVVTITMWEGVEDSWSGDWTLISQVILGIVYFGNVMLTCVVTSFLCFHVYMVANAVTTIELKEKMSVKFDRSPYYTSVYGNLVTVFGNNPLLWLLPVAVRETDEVSFKCVDTVA